jgi:nucleoside-diphosphate-sugar epimerase
MPSLSHQLLSFPQNINIGALFLSLIKNYVYRTCADTSLAEKELGFKAETELRKGIEELIEAYKRDEIVFGV